MKKTAFEYVACNLCGSNEASPYCKVGEFHIVRCRRCRLLYTNPRRPAEEIAEVYSEDYFISRNPSVLGYDDYSSHSEGLKRVFSEHLRTIRKFVSPPASIIDIGCAYGYFLQIAISSGWTAEGVEVSPYASEVARAKIGVPVRTGTISTAGLSSACYEVATMWDVLEHSFDPLGDLLETNRILKPHGYLFMTLPDAGSVLARVTGKYWFGFKKVAEHNYFFSRPTLGRLLSRAGFEVVDMRRGVWPCSMAFLMTKLEPYSATFSRHAQRWVRRLGVENATVKFRFIDMFVIARKQREASEGKPFK